MALTKTRVTRSKPRVLESRMERVKTERRELHPAVWDPSERCAGQCPTVSLPAPQSLRHWMAA